MLIAQMLRCSDAHFVMFEFFDIKILVTTFADHSWIYYQDMRARPCLGPPELPRWLFRSSSE